MNEFPAELMPKSSAVTEVFNGSPTPPQASNSRRHQISIFPAPPPTPNEPKLSTCNWARALISKEDEPRSHFFFKKRENSDKSTLGIQRLQLHLLISWAEIYSRFEIQSANWTSKSEPISSMNSAKTFITRGRNLGIAKEFHGVDVWKSATKKQTIYLPTGQAREKKRFLTKIEKGTTSPEQI
jgi:hypothetical protein